MLSLQKEESHPRPSRVRGAGATSTAAESYPLPPEFAGFRHFTSSIGSMDTVKPKARPVAWLMRHVEEMYDARYAKDTADLRGGDGGATGDEEAPGGSPFPAFVVDFFSKRYGLRSLIDTACWDLLFSVAAARRDNLEVEVFARFLSEAYDPDDLLFFLYVRSVAQKELGVSFRSRWTELGRSGAAAGAPSSGAGGDPAPLYLTLREAQLVSRVVFGSEADPLYKTFVAIVERAIGAANNSSSSRGRKQDAGRIEVSQFLYLALVEYHETRPSDGVASALDAAPAPPTPAASSPSAPPGGAAVLEQLGATMHAANEAYVDRLLSAAMGNARPAGTQPLPPVVVAQVRTEVQAQLEAKVDSLLADVINAAQELQQNSAAAAAAAAAGGKPALAALFLRVLAGGGQGDASVAAFCDAVLAHDDIRLAIEPLVSLLVTYATSKLEEGGE